MKLKVIPYYVRPCHDDMTRPRVADGAVGLQIWRAAVSILNNQTRTADKGWAFDEGLAITTRKKRNKLLNVKQGLETGRILWNDVGNGKRNLRFCTGRFTDNSSKRMNKV
jgi:hypothetical protein